MINSLLGVKCGLFHLSIAHTDVPVEFFDAFPYPGEVPLEDKATLGSDLSAGEMSGEEGETYGSPFSTFNLFSGPQSDKPRGSGCWPPEIFSRA